MQSNLSVKWQFGLNRGRWNLTNFQNQPNWCQPKLRNSEKAFEIHMSIGRVAVIGGSEAIGLPQ